MKILLLSRYERLGASSRVRSLQYVPFLESKNWEIDISPLFSDDYLRATYSGRYRGIYVLKGYWRRVQALIRAKKYDVIWIEKEIFPFMPALAERLLVKSRTPYIVDFDDAIFHRYDKNQHWLIRMLFGGKIDVIMKHAELVIAGNEYLAEKAISAGSVQVEIIPTVVDLKRYGVIRSDKKMPLIVGWIGSPSTSHYLSIIKPVYELLKKKFDVRFVAIGGSKDRLQALPIDVLPWSESTEVQSIQSFDIGIMPLNDSPWERGKCGYKLIQYMACGLPVVASPVGVNKQIIQHGVNGFLAQGVDEWEQALFQLLNDLSLRKNMGKMGRERVEKEYSLEVQEARMEKLFQQVLLRG